MKLSYETLDNKDFWESKGVKLPSYDVREITRKTVASPRWVHFGIGNIFRIFIGGVYASTVVHVRTDNNKRVNDFLFY